MDELEIADPHILQCDDDDATSETVWLPVQKKAGCQQRREL